MAALIVAFILKRGDQIKSGTIAGLWFIVAGVGRSWIELFRPDQPRFFGTPVSTSTVISIIFALLGIFIILVKSGKISVPFMQSGTTTYTEKSTRRPQRARR